MNQLIFVGFIGEALFFVGERKLFVNNYSDELRV
jgi:hypothetical protein